MKTGEQTRAEEQNYGVPDGIPAGNPPTGPMLLSAREEKSWSILAHLSIFLNPFTGFLGPVAALVIWMVFRDRSPKVAFHALQSMWYQVAWLVLLGAGWVLTGVLTLVLIGFLLMPAMALLTVAPFVHAAYAAYKVGKGEDFRYPLAGDLALGRFAPRE